MWSVKIGAYAVKGGSLTFGVDPATGRPFIQGGVGIGRGGGITYDPFGAFPGTHTNEASGSYCVYFGSSLSGTAGAGPLQGSVELRAAGVLHIDPNAKRVSGEDVSGLDLNKPRLKWPTETPWSFSLGAAWNVINFGFSW